MGCGCLTFLQTSAVFHSLVFNLREVAVMLMALSAVAPPPVCGWTASHHLLTALMKNSRTRTSIRILSGLKSVITLIWI